MLPAGSLSTGLKWLSALLLIGICAGCSTPSLETARMNFYAGRLQQADHNLTPLPDEDKDQLLFLMERGMIRQFLHQYDESSADWRAAGELDEQLETYSLSHGAASLITNDRMLAFRGEPFEQTLLFSFLANNYLAQGNWDYAAICARNIIQQLEDLDGFPDIAYSRYMAGFCLEMIDDMGNAALQYRIASDLLDFISINEETGQLVPETGSETNKLAGDARPVGSKTSKATAAPSVRTSNGAAKTSETCELVCFIGMGRIPSGNTTPFYSEQGPAPYAEIYCNNEYLGRSYPLDNTATLLADTEEQRAIMQLAKDISRIAIKETIAESLEQQNNILGMIARITLFAFEMPDTRRWETLPLWLQIARLPCPRTLASYKVVFKNASGQPMGSKTVVAPISRHGNVFISFCRDISTQSSE